MSRLSKVKYNGSIIAQYSYDELSRRTLLRRNDNADMNTVYQYDLGNRLTGLKNRFNAAQTQVIQYSEYDNVGNRKNMIVDNNEYSYTYDKLYQLVGVDYPAGFGTDTTYYYDKLGNRRKVEADTVTDYSSNNLNQYTAIGTTLPEYDASGNLTKYGSFRYFYDCENRLTDVNLNTVRKMHCQYDYLGRRVSKTVSSNTTKFCYDGDQIIAEYNGSGTLLRKYIYGPGIDEPICMINVNGGETKYYYHFDGLGSVVALSDSSGAVIESYRYNAFGQPSATSSIGNRFMFTGREYDTETGLYYYRARYYKPSIGRFLQTDPIVYIDSMNLYTYSLNNPVMLRDPSGMIGFRSWWGVSSRSECLSLAGRDRDERLNEARRLYNDALRLNDAGRDACHHGCDRAFPPGRCPGTDPGDANAGCKFLCDTAAGAVRTAAYAVYAATRTAIWTGYGIANATCRTLYP
jgi:RHS repeat-associated protein